MSKYLTPFILTSSILTTTILATGTSAQAAGLYGAAADYNVFVFENMINSSDSEGKVAVGGNATLTNFGTASKLGSTPNPATQISLVVGGNLNYQNGQVYGGRAIVGGNDLSPNGPYFNWCAGQDCGLTTNTTVPIDFTAARTYYEDWSSSLGALDATGTSTYYNWGGIQLSGSNSDLNVFDLDGSKFSSTNSFTINAPTNSTVLINVSGNSVSAQNFGFSLQGGIQKQNILFNFVDATSLTTGGLSYQGSILAPYADITFNNGNIEGQVIANSIQGSGEYHSYNFTGNLPNVSTTAVPEPFTILGSIVALGFGGFFKSKIKKS